MRLSEINHIISNIDIEKCYLIIDVNNNELQVSNIIKFKEIVHEIEKNNIDFLFDEIIEIKETKIYLTDLDKTSMIKKNALQLQGKVVKIKNTLEALSKVLVNITPTSNENSFSIKLPKPNNFEELTKDLSNIQKYIEPVLNDKKINSTVTLNNWEYGSYWIDLIVETGPALSLLASITWTAAYINKELGKAKEQSLYLQRMECGTEHLKKTQEIQLKYMDKLYE
ncbi:MAG: hypothetical protein GQ474_04140, partial [Sulfurimonas sp.]|nr:hypothetical protein [Sulfurimonas sp.]